MIEAGKSYWLPRNKLEKIFEFHGIEYAQAALAKGNGIILLGMHLTSMELAGRMIGFKIPLGVMYRPHKKHTVSFIQERIRKKLYSNLIPRNSIRDTIRALRDNIAIWVAYDIDAGLNSSVFAPFFGIETASLTSISRIAKMTDAAVIPLCFYRRENEFFYDIYLLPTLENFPTDDLKEDAARLNQILETAIRKKPDQFIWQYKRFKTRPPGEPRLY